MKGKFLLDTNIFVYSFDGASPAKARRSSQLIRDALTTREGIVSYQVVQEFFNIALKRFAKPMKSAEAEQYLATVFRPLLRIHSSEDLCVEALRLHGRYRLAWYDALIAAAALQGKCSILYTEDMQHGLRIGELRIENPYLPA